MKLLRFLAIPAAAAAGLILSSCSTVNTGTPGTSFSFDPKVTKPTNTSATKVYLSTGAQKIYVVEGDKVLLASPACVGTAATPTPKGTFPIRNKVKYRRRASSPGAGYPMTYWMEFSSPAYGMHWGFVKPYPATHGCVRLPLNTARKMFDMVQVGTRVNVASSQPWDNTVGKSLPRLDDGPLPNPPNSYLNGPQVFKDQDQGKMWNF
ncbi:L,D-transpeptidase [Haloferula sargassicola]|uniref:L,D-TPase catalytic domain-containing protein n=1 Tax=Haloferula sargassicola TaxID=490096 RepID=A0ABP9ULT7_9BACT